jgi:DNA-binding NtrC family response regulator
LAGEPGVGTISRVARDGRLAHRRADFVPLGLGNKSDRKNGHINCGVFVLLGDQDLLPQDLAGEMSGERSADELHRTIRRFRRAQAGRYSLESLLGDSSGMRKVRAQVAAAAASGANTLVYGHPGSGRGHVARAIHYCVTGDPPAKLVSLDGKVASDDSLRRAIDAASQLGESRQRSTLLLENLDCLSTSHQSQLLAAIRTSAPAARIIATCADLNKDGETGKRGDGEKSDAARQEKSPPLPVSPSPRLDPALCDAVSTIVIHVPPLVERIDDLPILTQYFLEACNRASGKQVGSIRADALDLLALHSWPGELDELRGAIAAAHRACTSHEIAAANLPAAIHHASHAALRIRRRAERVVLDELLARIEREAILRALAQAGGNKSEAADLLGMTRPRLYRRLVQLGLAADTAAESEPDGPEFIEREPGDESS